MALAHFAIRPEEETIEVGDDEEEEEDEEKKAEKAKKKAEIEVKNAAIEERNEAIRKMQSYINIKVPEELEEEGEGKKADGSFKTVDLYKNFDEKCLLRLNNWKDPLNVSGIESARSIEQPKTADPEHFSYESLSHKIVLVDPNQNEYVEPVDGEE